MSKRLIVIVSVVIFVILSPPVWAVRSPVGPGTVPPSSYSSGQIRTPNPIDTRGNLVITGNIRGGRHFRGVVPYQSETSFKGEIPSSSFDSFLRRSAGSEDLGRFSGEALPYYSPTRTVTSVRPGQTFIFKPPATTYGTYSARRVGSDSIETLLPRQYRRTGAIRPDTLLTNIRTRPMSKTTKQLEEILSTQIDRYPYITKSIPTDNVDRKSTVQIEQLQSDTKQVTDEAIRLKKGLIDQSWYEQDLRPAAKDKLSPEISQLPESERVWKTQKPKEPVVGDKPFDTYEKMDVYEQMKRQFDDFQKIYKPLRTKTKRKAERATLVDDDEEEKPENKRKSGRRTSSYVANSKVPGTDNFQTKNAASDKGSVSLEDNNIKTSHKTFASSIKDKFNEHIRAAENYLKEGKYYRAADAYTLASIYKPSDPLAYAGKSHALFAAGEYMSSALFLYKTLNMFPEYARFKIDIVAMVGDRDTLETRIADVERQLKKTDASELNFLLGYVYYQIGRLNEAKKQAEIAYKTMPDVLAAETLKEAVDNASK
ncbi:MAG: tetratricopeptide repeat protein [Planctomycetota bacterium]|jgi:hypothetical protein